MVLFFFYNTDLIKIKNINFESNAGYILIQSYNKDDDILVISDKSINNKLLLYGKIVKFNMSLEDVLQQINTINDCTCTIKKTVDTIWATKFIGGVFQTYIIY